MSRILIPIENSLIQFNNDGTIKWKRTFKGNIRQVIQNPNDKNFFLVFENGDIDLFQVDGTIMLNFLKGIGKNVQFIDDQKVMVITKSSIDIRDLKGVILKTIKTL